MATFLYHLGRAAFRRRWTVTLLWVAVLGAVGFAGVTAPASEDDGFSMPGIEAQKAFDLVEERFPGTSTDGAKAQIVFVAPKGEKVTATDNAESGVNGGIADNAHNAHNKAAVEHLVDEAADGPQVATVVDPFQAKSISKDGSTAYTTVTFQDKAADLGAASKEHLEHAVRQARNAGLTVEIGGDALATQPSSGGDPEAIGIAMAAVVLLVTFGSMAGAGLPLLTAVLGIGVSVAAVLALGSVFGLSATTGSLAAMLGLACGIDYALFIVSRYREERAKGQAPREAAGLAAGTAGSAVVFAGLTVVIALAGLSVVNTPMLTKMGLSAAGAVLLSVLVCLTLVPALLGFWPDAVLSRGVRKGKKRDHSVVEDNGGSRWARLVIRRPLPVLLLGTVALGALAVPAAGLRLGIPGDESKPVTDTGRRAYDALAEGFGPGFNGPLTVVVDARGAGDPRHAVSVISQEIGSTDGIVSLSPAGFNKAGDTATLSAIPSTSPTDVRTIDLVNTIRDERPGVEAETGATFEVTGSTAMKLDISERIRSALVPYLLVVVGLAVVLLLLAFRSFLVPVKAALGYLLSVLAALGAVVLVFQEGHGAALLGVEQTGPIMSMMPIFLVGILFGLAMDYEVFLVSRIRESYVQGDPPGQAVVSGFRSSARVVTAAALIMTAVFSGFISAEDPMIKMLASGLAVAILFDAFVVRMALVPAVLALLGDRAWGLPPRLDRILPGIDVEGGALTRGHGALPATDVEEAVAGHR